MVTAANLIPFDNGAMRDLQIKAEVQEIRAIVEQMEYLENAVAAKKARLRTLLEARGESWSDESGYARLMADSTRRSFNADALDKLMLRSKWWDARLRPYRKEFPVRGGVQVR